MNFPVLALVALLLLAIWLFIRVRRSAPDDRPDRRSTSPSIASGSKYHAVSIKMPGNACEAAKDLTGRRFLSTAAPKLPLPDCDALECSCRFVHHKDRRSGKDRRSPFSPAGFGGGTGSFERDLRQGEDRRANKDEDYF